MFRQAYLWLILAIKSFTNYLNIQPKSHESVAVPNPGIQNSLDPGLVVKTGATLSQLYSCLTSNVKSLQKYLIVLPNSNSEENSLPIVVVRNSGYHSRPGHIVQIRAALCQVYRRLISIVKVTAIHHHNRSGSQDQQAHSQHHHYSFHTHGASNNDVNPIMLLFQRKKLSNTALSFAMPMAVALLIDRYAKLTLLKASLIIMALSLGFATTLNGMLLRGMCPRTASVLEIFGVAAVIVAFYGLISSYLPRHLVWTSWLCCVLSCSPLVLSLLPLTPASTGLMNDVI